MISHTTTAIARALPLALLLASPFAGGCALHRVETDPAPALQLPAAFDAAAAADAEPSPDRWWEAFGDPALDALEAEALEGNLDLTQTWARLDQLEALRVQAGAGRWPTAKFDANTGFAKTRFDLNLPTGPNGQEVETTIFTTLTTYSSSVSAAYELDLFRKNDFRARAGIFDASAARDSLEAAAMTLTANVAESYFNLLLQREQIALLEAQLATGRTYLELLQLRFDSGLASALDLHQQEQQIAQTLGQIAATRGQQKVAALQLAVLLGRMPTGYQPPGEASLPKLPAIPAMGLPSDLLVRRPDLRAAKRQLVAADYRLGASIADRLPSIRLSVSTSLRSTSLDSFISQPLYNLLAGLTQPLFQAGRLKAETARSQAVVDEKAAAFARALVQAVYEVESAAVLERAQTEQIKHSETALEAARGALDDARMRYGQGLIDTYLPVLSALTAKQLAEQALLAARRQQISYRVTLYRALGGSWTETLAREPGKAGAGPETDEASAEAARGDTPRVSSSKEGRS